MFKNARNFYGINGVQGGLREWMIETTNNPLKEVVTEANENILDGNNLYDACPHVRAGEVFHGHTADAEMSCLRPTGYNYTCIADGGVWGTSKYAYAICHKTNEYVKFVNVDALGSLDFTGANVIQFQQLVRMKRIGIVTLSALGGGGAQSFDVKDGSSTTAINRVDIAAAGQIGFENNTPVGTFSEIACNYISNCVHIVHHGAAVAANAGNAVVYIVYDNETDVEVAMPLGASNATRSVTFISPQVYAKLIKVDKKITYASGALTGDNRFAVKNGANNATAPATLTAEWTPVADDNEIFKGDLISLAQTNADSQNRQVAVTAKLRFASAV